MHDHLALLQIQLDGCDSPGILNLQNPRVQVSCHAWLHGSLAAPHAATSSPLIHTKPGRAAKGIATSGLLAYIATAKFCDALPLYRQEKQFARLGVQLSRRTMADWMLAVGRSLSPLLEVLHEQVRSGPVVQID